MQIKSSLKNVKKRDLGIKIVRRRRGGKMRLFAIGKKIKVKQ